MPEGYVFVSGYYRGDGTYVDPHFRRYPASSIYHDPSRPPYQGARRYSAKEIAEMQREAREKLAKKLQPKLDGGEVKNRGRRLKAKRAEATPPARRQKQVRRLNERVSEVFENDHAPARPAVERQQAMIDDPPVWKPMPDT